ncbi:cyclic nucleotide-binding domain-containing protein [Legionella sp. km772]|uniref:cyclic nucleotide-binding domain-containing protein n=1 Tax=Legionella sp. km772 TaxID=2498111 RepID=UPI000F8DB5F7|nr:cyclic nucleotide-binding domain-containing protein [Legionella sp. km772]RUR11157.1 cyclic nucleotide-binding domain-containing protein [Legionella sp. km772]
MTRELNTIPLFDTLNEKELSLCQEYLEEKEFAKDEYIIRQGDKDKDVYIITKGQVGVYKTKEGSSQEHQLSTLSVGDVFGELAFIDHAPRSTSIKTLVDTQLLHLSAAHIGKLIQHHSIYWKLSQKILIKLSSRIRYTNEVIVSSLEKELELKKTQVTAGNFMVLMLVMLTLFTYLLKGMSYLTELLGTASMITTVAMLILFFIFWVSAKRTGYPLSFFGFSTQNWQAYFIESLLWTTPILLLMTLAKWLLISNVAKYSSIELFSLGHSAVAKPGTSTLTIVLMSFAYVFISSPIQEVLFRGGLQSCLQFFLQSKHRNLLANITTNLIFAMMHLILSYELAILVFGIGFFWGCLYQKQRTLVGVITSHILIGVWAFFILGIQSIVMAK